MTLLPGARLGPYEVTSAIGAGGMGEVFRARDTKLNRDVAIKVLPAAFADDPERLARFTREAQALASLNHPNIATIHGIEEVPATGGPGAGSNLGVGGRALVMELVLGEDLSTHIARGPIPVAEALPIARQMAEALEAAHEQGIVHRDLKPANIKVRTDGTVKVLDFGLANAMEPGGAPPSNPDVSRSPTLTHHGTSAGMIIGTAAYMSPEQAKGKPVDKRADIWAFGVVLYEMLSGKRAFQGEDVSDLLVAVLSKEVDMSALPVGTPPAIIALIRRGLLRDPKSRLRDIGEARVVLSSPADSLAAPPLGRRTSTLWLATAAGCLLLGIAGGSFLGRPPEPEGPVDRPVIRFAIDPPRGTTFERLAKVSPDGTHLAFFAMEDGVERLWIQRLDQDEARVIAGTDGGDNLFWSDDSRHLGYFHEDKLMRVAIDGGSPRLMCALGPLRSGTMDGAWAGGPEGHILFSYRGAGSTVYRVNAAGGRPEPVTALDSARKERRHVRPQFLPGGRRFLYAVQTEGSELHETVVGELPTGSTPPSAKAATPLLLADSPAEWTPEGYLLFARDSILMAQAFDPVRLQLTGEPWGVEGNIPPGFLRNLNRAGLSVSDNGILNVYRGVPTRRRMVWLDRQGKEVETIVDGEDFSIPRLSPDGAKVVGVRTAANGFWDLWQLDLVRSTVSRFTFDPRADGFPVWSPDGARLVYGVNNGTKYDLYVKAADGSGEPALLVDSPFQKQAFDWSRDGKWILYLERLADRREIRALAVSGDLKPITLLSSKSRLDDPSLSPDDRFLAYSSDESGRAEVYVRRFAPGAVADGSQWQVSNGGGEAPRWRSDGRELFYTERNRRAVAVPVAQGSTFQAGRPQVLFDFVADRDSLEPRPDGQRFLVMLRDNRTIEPQRLVVNWAATRPKRK